MANENLSVLDTSKDSLVPYIYVNVTGLTVPQNYDMM